MKFLDHWRKSWHRPESPTASEIRQQLATVRRQRDQVTAKQDAIVLDAMGSDAAAKQYHQFDAELAELTQQVKMLEAALPRAEQAEADAYAKRLERFRQQTAKAQRWTDAEIIARLPIGKELTEAREMRDALRAEANWLSRRSRDADVRRPFDPLDAIYAALAMRVQRIERARWIHGDHPITLLDDTRAAS